MRAEMFEIKIGENTNLQDFVMVHVGAATPTIVGDNCSITHHCTIHGCTIGDNCLIGINATLMDGVKIGNNCIVAGHCIINEGKEFPDNSVIAGVPGKLIATRDNSERTRFNAAFYNRIARNYAKGIERLSIEDLCSWQNSFPETWVRYTNRCCHKTVGATSFLGKISCSLKNSLRNIVPLL